MKPRLFSGDSAISLVLMHKKDKGVLTIFMKIKNAKN